MLHISLAIVAGRDDCQWCYRGNMQQIRLSKINAFLFFQFYRWIFIMGVYINYPCIRQYNETVCMLDFFNYCAYPVIV